MKPQTEQSYAERMLRVLVYIQEHLDDALSIEDLARVAHFSPYHFHRIFRGMVGESVIQHIRRLRLERGAHYLKHSDQPVTRIAFDAGYESHEAFTRAFAAMFAQPPSQFRETHRPVPVPSVGSGVHYRPDGKLERFEPTSQGDLPMDVRIETIKPQRVAFIRHVGPYNQVASAWQKLCSWAGPRGLLGPQTVALGVCHDDPEVTPPDRIRYDACITVDDSVQPEGEVGVQEVFGGEYAITTHRGPYEKFAETYARLCGEWLPASGRELRSAPGVEIYRNDPNTTPPEQLLTDIHVPLEPRS